jgi:hypothetical protein
MPAVIAELASLPPGATATREQLDALAGYTADLVEYSRRAWRDCGTAKP